MRSLVLAVLVLAVASAMAQPYLYHSSSEIAGCYIWGSDNWIPYQWYRYAQTQLRLLWTESLARPTYLNLILVTCSPGVAETIDVYIDTVEMLNAPRDSWVYYDAGWWNWHTKDGGYYVGRYVTPTSTNEPGLVSFNVDAWVQTHQTSRKCFFIVLDQLDKPDDAECVQAWFGPEGAADIGSGISEPCAPPTPKFGAHRTSPCPTRGTVSLGYYLSQGGPTSARLYDSQGRLVRTLATRAYQQAGEQTLSWDGRDDSGRAASVGSYYCVVETPFQSMQFKVVTGD